MAAVTGAVITGAALAATTTISFVQANKQKKLQKEAQRDAKEALGQARRLLGVNFYDELAIQKEPYELRRDALLSAGAQAIQAGVEGESRGVAPTAGRVLMAQNEAQAEQRTAMGQEMMDLEKLSAMEDSRLRDIGVQLDLEEAAGAQLAARDAQEAAAAATAQGMAGIQAIAQTAIQAAPLYMKNISAEKAAVSKITMTPEEQAAFRAAGGASEDSSIPLDFSGSTGRFRPYQLPGTAPSPVDFSATGSMSNAEYRRFLRGLTEEQRQLLFQNQTYNPNPFQPF